MNKFLNLLLVLLLVFQPTWLLAAEEAKTPAETKPVNVDAKAGTPSDEDLTADEEASDEDLANADDEEFDWEDWDKEDAAEDQAEEENAPKTAETAKKDAAPQAPAVPAGKK